MSGAFLRKKATPWPRGAGRGESTPERARPRELRLGSGDGGVRHAQGSGPKSPVRGSWRREFLRWKKAPPQSWTENLKRRTYRKSFSLPNQLQVP